MTSYRFSSPPCWRCFIVPMLTMYSFAPVSRCPFWCRLCFNWHDIFPVSIVPLLTMFYCPFADNVFLLRLLHNAFLMSFVAPPVGNFFLYLTCHHIKFHRLTCRRLFLVDNIFLCISFTVRCDVVYRPHVGEYFVYLYMASYQFNRPNFWRLFSFPLSLLPMPFLCICFIGPFWSTVSFSVNCRWLLHALFKLAHCRLLIDVLCVVNDCRILSWSFTVTICCLVSVTAVSSAHSSSECLLNPKETGRCRLDTGTPQRSLLTRVVNAQSTILIRARLHHRVHLPHRTLILWPLSWLLCSNKCKLCRMSSSVWPLRSTVQRQWLRNPS